MRISLGTTFVGLLAAGALALPAAPAAADPPCDQSPPSDTPTFVEPYGNRFYAGNTIGVWGSGNWYVYADGDDPGGPALVGKDTTGGWGFHLSQGRQCFEIYGYKIL